MSDPVFILLGMLDLRLQLLEADQYPYLFKTLFGLLMLLPQSTAFETLKTRLSAVTSLGVMQVMPKTKEKASLPKEIKFDEMLKHFTTLQQQHAASIRASTFSSSLTPPHPSYHYH